MRPVRPLPSKNGGMHRNLHFRTSQLTVSVRNEDWLERNPAGFPLSLTKYSLGRNDFAALDKRLMMTLNVTQLVQVVDHQTMGLF